MGRPVKKGLSYFPHDTNLHEDVKVRKLIKKYGGGTAAYIYTTFLEKIYSQGYYLEFQEDDYFIMAELVYEEEGFVRNVLNGCIELGLFDKSLYVSHNIITSKAIQERYLEIERLLQHTVKLEEYNLLSSDHVNKVKTMGSQMETEVSTMENGVSTIETPVTTQESTRNKIKENKKKTLSLASSAHTCASGEDFDFEKEMQKLKENKLWLQEFMKLYDVPEPDIDEVLEKFSSFCRLNEKTDHDDASDLKDHLKRWMSSENRNKSSQPNPTSRHSYDSRQRPTQQSDSLRQQRNKPFEINGDISEKDYEGDF